MRSLALHALSLSLGTEWGQPVASMASPQERSVSHGYGEFLGAGLLPILGLGAKDPFWFDGIYHLLLLNRKNLSVVSASSKCA